MRVCNNFHEDVNYNWMRIYKIIMLENVHVAIPNVRYQE